jgi:hypothetical protein
MKTDFKVIYQSPILVYKPLNIQQFSNLLGTVYGRGNLVFTPDGDALFSPVGNRVSVFNLTRYIVYLDFERHEADLIEIRATLYHSPTARMSAASA